MNNTELRGRVQIHLPLKKKKPPAMTGRASVCRGNVQDDDVLRVCGAFPCC